MGFEDIAYDVFKEYRIAKGNEVKRKSLAILLCKKAYLKFNFDWETEIKSKGNRDEFGIQKEILSQYSQIFTDVAVEIIDTLPEESENLKRIATIMKTGSHATFSHNVPRINSQGEYCSTEVMNRVGILNQML